MKKFPPSITWEPPLVSGALSRFAGPGATAAELWLQFGVAAVAAAGLVLSALLGDWSWSRLQLAIVALLAFDIAGGIATNSTAAAKRWYHRKGRTARHHASFVALHGLHVLVAAAVFYPSANELVALGYPYLLAATALLLRMPVYLQRPVSFVLTGIGVLGSVCLIDTPAHFEWFLPALYVKLLLAYLPVEAPFAHGAE